MTVCATAICAFRNGAPQCTIIGIADHMITWGDVASEPRNYTKICVMPPAKVAVLGSNDIQFFWSINKKTRKDVEKIAAITDGLTDVRDIGIEEIAVFQRDNFEQYRREILEHSLLVPFGLTTESFVLRKKKDLSRALVKSLEDKLLTIKIDDEATSIVCGFDEGGPHIYSVDFNGISGNIACHDAVGYKAIGCGASLFESHMNAHHYDITWSLPAAIFLMYVAKRNSEASPGVGKLTDIFLMDASHGFRELLPPKAMDALEEHYQKFTGQVESRRKQTIDEIADDDRIPKTV